MLFQAVVAENANRRNRVDFPTPPHVPAPTPAHLSRPIYGGPVPSEPIESPQNSSGGNGTQHFPPWMTHSDDPFGSNTGSFTLAGDFGLVSTLEIKHERERAANGQQWQPRALACTVVSSLTTLEAIGSRTAEPLTRQLDKSHHETLKSALAAIPGSSQQHSPMTSYPVSSNPPTTSSMPSKISLPKRATSLRAKLSSLRYSNALRGVFGNVSTKATSRPRHEAYPGLANVTRGGSYFGGESVKPPPPVLTPPGSGIGFGSGTGTKTQEGASARNIFDFPLTAPASYLRAESKCPNISIGSLGMSLSSSSSISKSFIGVKQPIPTAPFTPFSTPESKPVEGEEYPFNSAINIGGKIMGNSGRNGVEDPRAEVDSSSYEARSQLHDRSHSNDTNPHSASTPSATAVSASFSLPPSLLSLPPFRGTINGVNASGGILENGMVENEPLRVKDDKYIPSLTFSADLSVRSESFPRRTAGDSPTGTQARSDTQDLLPTATSTSRFRSVAGRPKSGMPQAPFKFLPPFSFEKEEGAGDVVQSRERRRVHCQKPKSRLLSDLAATTPDKSSITHLQLLNSSAPFSLVKSKGKMVMRFRAYHYSFVDLTEHGELKRLGMARGRRFGEVAEGRRRRRLRRSRSLGSSSATSDEGDEDEETEDVEREADVLDVGDTMRGLERLSSQIRHLDNIFWIDSEPGYGGKFDPASKPGLSSRSVASHATDDSLALADKKAPEDLGLASTSSVSEDLRQRFSHADSLDLDEFLLYHSRSSSEIHVLSNECEGQDGENGGEGKGEGSTEGRDLNPATIRLSTSSEAPGKTWQEYSVQQGPIVHSNHASPVCEDFATISVSKAESRSMSITGSLADVMSRNRLSPSTSALDQNGKPGVDIPLEIRSETRDTGTGLGLSGDGADAIASVKVPSPFMNSSPRQSGTNRTGNGGLMSTHVSTNDDGTVVRSVMKKTFVGKLKMFVLGK